MERKNQINKLIVCPKGFGNTHKVCSYVAANSDIDLRLVSTKERENDLTCYDVIILASGIYVNHVHKNLIEWIDSIEENTINMNTKFYIFLTWFGRGNSDKAAFNEVKCLLENKGIKLEDNHMKCFGKGMGMIKLSHPNEEDCKNVLFWVNKL